MDRKIIFKARIGSHLHGTSTPKSDEDYLGVYLPSVEDMIGIENRPKEWTDNIHVTDGPRNSKGDVDCKYLPLYVFLKEAAQGQSQSLELLFVLDEHVIIKEPEWDIILQLKDRIISKNSILPFIGFAKSQCHKSKLKGENLNTINKLIMKLNALILAGGHNADPISKHLESNAGLFETEYYLFGVPVKFYENEHGVKLIRIAHRDYDLNINYKKLRDSLVKLEEKYGERSRLAAEVTYDFKSVTHAFRLCGEAQELLSTGVITFPRPDAQFLLDVKLGNYNGDLDVDIEKQLDILRKIRDNSSLRDKPDWKKINKLCQQMILDHWNTWEK